MVINGIHTRRRESLHSGCTLRMYCLHFLVMLLIMILNSDRCSSDTLKCKIRCGILDIKRGQTRLPDFVESVWRDMKNTYSKVEMQFITIQQHTEMTMDELWGAYVGIGTKNVSALIGPYMHPIATITEKFGIPYFLTTEVEKSYYKPFNLISVFPSPSSIVPITVDVVRRYHWKDVAVFYESEDDARIVEDLTLYPDMHIRSWKISPSFRQDELTNTLLQARQLRITKILVMATRDLVRRLLNEGLRLSMLSNRYSWILPSLKQDQTDLLEVAYTQVNLTTFHLDASHFSDFEYATVYDCLLTLYRGILLHHRQTESCHWSGREHLLPVLSQISARGATGDIRFREDGTRKGYVVNIFALGQQGLYNKSQTRILNSEIGSLITYLTIQNHFISIGHWNSSVKETEKRLILDNDELDVNPDISLEYPLGKDIVKVVTITEPPFMMLKTDHQKRVGNDKFEGFCYDLLEAIADMLDFKFELYLVPDNSFGNQLPNGSWDGMVREIMNGNASLAMASLTISSLREEVIDFSKPFKTFGISVLMRRPRKKHSLFQFTEPLSASIWILLGGALIFVSLSLYMVDKAVPARDPTVKFDCSESLWFTFASMVLSGTDMIPRTIPSRILAASLWFFSLIIISSYTANLAAFLTVSKFETPIHSVNDLPGQTKVRYGTVINSQVSDFFENSKLQHFQTMWEFMTAVDQTALVSTTEEGYKKVKESDQDFAFMWDSPVVSYKVIHDCDFVSVGHSFDSRGYGIGVPLGARYRDELTMAILKLSESGFIQELDYRWWRKSLCPDLQKATVEDTQSLTMEKVAGIFLILAAGITLSLIACAIQCIIARLKRRSRTPKNRKIPDKNSPAKPLYEKDLSSALQLEDSTYMTNIGYNRTPIAPKQTNIF